MFWSNFTQLVGQLVHNKCASIQECKYASILICRQVNMPICKYSNKQVFQYANIEVCKYASIHVCKYANQRWKKYFIFCQPDKKIENFLPHLRNFKWGILIYICRNHMIYVNSNTLLQKCQYLPHISQNWWIIHKLFQYFENIFCQILSSGIFSVN